LEATISLAEGRERRERCVLGGNQQLHSIMRPLDRNLRIIPGDA
jgi:hypothetical protein